MSFTLQLAQDQVDVEAGATTPVSVVVTNRGTTVDRYELEIEGIDPEWKAVPVPVFPAEPNELHTEKVFIRPPRASESLSGNYPFVVRVRSLESGEFKTVQGIVKLKPFHHLSMEISPKKGSVSPTSKKNDFTVTLVNLGNTEHTIQLLGNDPEDSCTYEFQQEQVTLAPGQQRDVEVVVNPASNPVFSSSKLIGFSVTGRSVDTPSVVSSAQAQLEQRSLISPATLTGAFLLLCIFLAWLMMMPKTPGVQLTITPMQAIAGSNVVVRWDAHDATRVVITAGSDTLFDGTDPRGEVKYQLPPVDSGSKNVQIEAQASRDGRLGVPDIRQVVVQAPVETPLPKINAFKVSARRVKQGGTVTFSWSVDGASRVAITPVKDDIAPALEQMQVSPTETQEYRLVAFNEANQSVRSEPIKVEVFEESDATIISFTASPSVVKEEDPHTTLSWQVSGAARVELKYGIGPAQSVDPTGTQDETLTGKTVFILTAYDSKARTISRRLVVYFRKTPPPVSPPPTEGTTVTTGTAGTDTGGSTSAGTGTATAGTTNGVTTGAGR